MTFKEHYQQLKSQPTISPAKSFIIAIASNLNRSEKTVQQWLCESQEPPMEAKVKISRLMRLPVEELFPSK